MPRITMITESFKKMTASAQTMVSTPLTSKKKMPSLVAFSNQGKRKIQSDN